jgi:hypothetical protein
MCNSFAFTAPAHMINAKHVEIIFILFPFKKF